MTAHLHHTTHFTSKKNMNEPTPPKPIRVTGRDKDVQFQLDYHLVHAIAEDDDTNRAWLAKKPVKFMMEFQTPEKCAEFFRLMARALNCNDPDETPEWALGLMDYVTGTPTPPTPQTRPQGPSNAPSGPMAAGKVDSTLAIPDEDDWLSTKAA